MRRPWSGLALAILVFTMLSRAQAIADDAGGQDQPASKSGFGELPSIEGPDGVASELEAQDKLKDYRITILHDALRPWFDWKAKLQDTHGLSLGFNATVLGQYSGDSLGENDTAAGGIYRFQGSWQAVDRDGDNPGSLGFRLEHRRKIGPIGPSDFSPELGVAAVNTGFAYSRVFDLDLSVLNWTQLFAKGRAGFIVGRLDFAALLDPYPFQTFSRSFINRAFV